MPDTKKNIEAALTELKRQKTRLEKNIRELAAARAERTRVVSAIKDLEHALKTVRGRKRVGKKPGPKPKKKIGRKPKAKARRKKPGPKPKVAKKKVAKKTAKGWTKAKRAAQSRKVKAFWAKKSKAGAKASTTVAKKKPGPKPKGKKPGPKPKKVAKKTTNRSKAWTPAKRAAMRKKMKAHWAKKKTKIKAA